jgi:hypothetical protein
LLLQIDDLPEEVRAVVLSSALERS